MSATHPPEQPMPSAMTTEEALTILRDVVELLRGCPDDDVAEMHAELADEAIAHLATIADPDALTAAYLAGVHHDGECRRHSCRRVRIEMQVEIERLRSAIVRQVANIDRWLETGIAADADESKSIYDQLCEAIGTAMAKERGE